MRYFVALADVGSFTRAAERMFIAQPTLSQQIRRLEEIVGTPLLQRRHDGVRLTKAGTVLLDSSRDVLSLVDHGISRTRQAAGLGRPRLRMVVPPGLPEALAVKTATLLRSAAETAEVDVVWLERPLDAGFSLIARRQADAGLGWLITSPGTLPDPLDAMNLGEFEPEVWVPGAHPASRRGTISLGELASMDVIHGPRRAERQPAPPDPADPVRHRRQRHLARPSRARRARPGKRLGRGGGHGRHRLGLEGVLPQTSSPASRSARARPARRVIPSFR